MRKRFRAVFVIGLALIFPASINTQWHTNGFLNFPGAVFFDEQNASMQLWPQLSDLQTHDYFAFDFAPHASAHSTPAGYTFETRFFLNDAVAPATLLALRRAENSLLAFRLSQEHGQSLVAEFWTGNTLVLKLTAAQKLAANAWLEVAAVYEAFTTDAPRARLYLNGELIAAAEVAKEWLLPERATLYLGNVPDGKTFSGKLDDVRISNTARYHGPAYRLTQTRANDAHTLAFWNFEQAVAAQPLQVVDKPANGARLVALAAKREGLNKITLEWRTLMERGLEGFIIERRAGSAEGEFARCGFMPALGNSAAPQEYHFVDTPPVSGAYYYRLRALAQNGDSGFSHEVLAQK